MKKWLRSNLHFWLLLALSHILQCQKATATGTQYDALMYLVRINQNFNILNGASE